MSKGGGEERGEQEKCQGGQSTSWLPLRYAYERAL